MALCPAAIYCVMLITESKWERLSTDTEALPSLFVIGDAGLLVHNWQKHAPGQILATRTRGIPIWRHANAAQQPVWRGKDPNTSALDACKL